jgi:cycloeucalenol cycloisomerase
MIKSDPEGGYWFSRNPSKAWGEKFFLCYLPFFFALNAGKQAFGWMDAGNLWHVGQNILMLAPLYIIPFLIRDETSLGRKWHQTYWFKFNLWIYIFAFVATYFFTEYFFDVLGMVYYFPQVSWYWDSALLGSGEQRIPLGMYFNAAAFFVVYHTVAFIVMRRILTSRINKGWPVAIAVIVCAAFFFAWAETRLVATDANKPFFYYKDLAWMLSYGSGFYACYFLVSFPFAVRIDEEEGDNWPLSKVIIEALAASMVAFFLLDLVAGQM